MNQKNINARTTAKVFQKYKKQAKVNVVKKISLENYSRAMILAPHMDDEVIGLCGVISDFLELGRKIALVFLVDKDSNGTDFKKRKKESKKIFRGQAINRLYLGFKDGQLDKSNCMLKIEQLIIEYSPDIVFFTAHAMGNHEDHEALADLCFILSKLYKTKIDFFGYQVERFIDADYYHLVKDKKKKIREIKKYKSQLKKVNYLLFMDLISIKDEGDYEYLKKY